MMWEYRRDIGSFTLGIIFCIGWSYAHDWTTATVRKPLTVPAPLFGGVAKDSVQLGVDESTRWRELITGLANNKRAIVTIELEDK